MRSIVVVAHNLRSAHNVGSLLRTADGIGVTMVYLTGYTPYPKMTKDPRLPHLAAKVHKQIAKTALGAEAMVDWSHKEDVFKVINQLKADGFKVKALEQGAGSKKLADFDVPEKIAILLGREVEGVENNVLDACDGSLEIPMFGQKESFNVIQAAAMALYHCRFA